MAVKLILPANAPDDAMVAFLSNRVREYFNAADLIAYSIGDTRQNVATAAGVSDIASINKLSTSPDDTLVFVTNADGSVPDLPNSPQPAVAQYYINRMGRIFSRKQAITAAEFPELETHVFNRLGPRVPTNTFYYYPYGFLFRDTTVGQIDSLGFRVPSDLSFLENRPSSHKVIVIFGGSAAFSMYSTTSEMFSTVLEKNLTQKAKETHSEVKITVLNFGMHGHVVINEMMTFLLYCNRIKPDFVLAHDGWNDFVYGLISDHFLLDHWGVVYQYNLESWSQLVHGTHTLPVGQPRVPFEPRNLPFSVLRAYLTRKRQFASLVEAAGATFIWGLQPSTYDKKSLSDLEQARTTLDPGTDMHAFAKVYPKARSLYQAFMEAAAANEIKNFVNFPAHFSKIDGTSTVFADHVHTVPEGDKVIADIYTEVLAPMLFQAGKIEPTSVTAKTI